MLKIACNIRVGQSNLTDEYLRKYNPAITLGFLVGVIIYFPFFQLIPPL